MIPAQRRCPPRISLVITAHNEGIELLRTVESIRGSTSVDTEIILVDDGSTDGCCENCDFGTNLRRIRHDVRVGVARSRDEGTALAQGDVVGYLDGHQRIVGNSLERCADLALTENAIVCPDVCGFDDDNRLHGAYFVMCRERKLFSAEWKHRMPSGGVGRITSLKAPAYFIPQKRYPLVGWSRMLRGWGGSEAAVSLKAFFAGVDILHLCGPLIRHQFKKSFHYEVGWPEVWRNHAINARICFEERTWYEYWLPEVFDGHLDDETRRDLESEAMKAEHSRFARTKVRQDREFWSRLVFQKMPAVLQ